MSSSVKMPTSYGVKLTASLVSNDHLLCDSTQPSDCSHCSPKPITICCDICHPSFFAKYRRMPQDLTKTSRRTGQSQIAKHDRTEAGDRCLQGDLLHWHEENALKKFRACLLRDFGANLLMSDEVIDYIVLCTNGNKISTINNVMRETGWTNQSH